MLLKEGIIEAMLLKFTRGNFTIQNIGSLTLTFLRFRKMSF